MAGLEISNHKTFRSKEIKYFLQDQLAFGQLICVFVIYILL